MTVTDAFNLIDRGGVLPVMLLIVVGFLRGWIVPGWMYRQEQERGDRWERLALIGTEMAERLTKIAPARKRTPRES